MQTPLPPKIHITQSYRNSIISFRDIIRGLAEGRRRPLCKSWRCTICGKNALKFDYISGMLFWTCPLYNTKLRTWSWFQQSFCSNDIWVANREVVVVMKDKHSKTGREFNVSYTRHVQYILFSFSLLFRILLDSLYHHSSLSNNIQSVIHLKTRIL